MKKETIALIHVDVTERYSRFIQFKLNPEKYLKECYYHLSVFLQTALHFISLLIFYILLIIFKSSILRIKFASFYVTIVYSIPLS